MTLYQFEDCPYCQKVRRVLSELLLTYVCVNVPQARHLREAVVAVSGQPSVPVLVDGDVMLDDEDTIIPYLRKTYAP